MNKEELKQKQIELKREFIVGVARELFFGKGYENTTIDEVAQAAEMSKSTLYTYVQSKEELFMHIHLQGMRQRVAIIEKKMSDAASGYDKIRTFGEEYYNFYTSNPGYFRLQMYEDYNTLDKSKIDAALSEEFDRLLSGLIQLVQDAFTLGKQDGSFDTSIPSGYLDKYFAYTIRTILNVAINPEKTAQIKDIFDEKQFFFLYLEMFISSIRG